MVPGPESTASISEQHIVVRIDLSPVLESGIDVDIVVRVSQGVEEIESRGSAIPVESASEVARSRANTSIQSAAFNAERGL